MPDGLSNLEASERVIAAILDALRERGLQDGEFGFEDLQLSEEFAEYFDSAFIWLMDEGIVRTGNTQRYIGDETMSIIRPSLTAKGFALLGQPFAGTESLAEHASKISKGHVSTSAAGDFLGGLLGGFTKSMGS